MSTFNRTRFGCRFGQPHDLVPVKDTPQYKVERCQICNTRFKWIKGFKGRVHSTKYLAAHLRNYAQEGGVTNRVFQKLYSPEKTIIKV